MQNDTLAAKGANKSRYGTGLSRYARPRRLLTLLYPGFALYAWSDYVRNGQNVFMGDILLIGAILPVYLLIRLVSGGQDVFLLNIELLSSFGIASKDMGLWSRGLFYFPLVLVTACIAYAAGYRLERVWLHVSIRYGSRKQGGL